MIIITSGRSTGGCMNISGKVARWGWDMRESGEKQGARGKEQGVMAKKAEKRLRGEEEIRGLRGPREQ
ncbi:MAG: hypothetical protein IPN60_12530 [Saprospiraceae bacterium]|nr:hypothetical protein [Candidatus Opimibacter skivensis]